MSKLAQRTVVPSVIGRLVFSAYIFSDESDTHGVVLTLADGSDISVEFSCERRLAWTVFRCKEERDEAVSIQT